MTNNNIKYADKFILPDGEEIYLKSASGGGLEIGDIGIAPIGIDESLNKRRYLNGQIIMVDQFPDFTSKIKAKTTSMPNLFCTETEWQAAKTASAYGQVGKFVLNYSSVQDETTTKTFDGANIMAPTGTSASNPKNCYAIDSEYSWPTGMPGYEGADWATNVVCYEVIYPTETDRKVIATHTITDYEYNSGEGILDPTWKIKLDGGSDWVNVGPYWKGSSGTSLIEYQYTTYTQELTSIRLPRVVNIQGVLDLSNAGLTVEAGLPNITGNAWYSAAGQTGSYGLVQDRTTNGCFKSGTPTNYHGLTVADGTKLANALGFDASLSSSIYGNSATVQPEAIQYPYFIQVATGAEYEEPVINEYTVTSAYSYGMSQYYPGIMNNNAWLRSNGQYNSGAVYVGLYNWILANVNNGVEGFKGTGYAYTSGSNTYYISTSNPVAGATVYGGDVCMPISTVTAISENSISFMSGTDSITATRSSTNDKTITDNYWITDYDYGINTTNQTFRLPLLDGSESLYSHYTNLTFPTLQAGVSITAVESAPRNGWYRLQLSAGVSTFQDISLSTSNGNLNVCSSEERGVTLACEIYARRGDTVYAYINNTTYTPLVFAFCPAVGNGNLYYYCGNVEQDAALINSARVREQLVEKVDAAGAAKASLPVPYSNKNISYSVTTSGQQITSPGDGFFYVRIISTAESQAIRITNINNNLLFSADCTRLNKVLGGFVPVNKGDVVKVDATTVDGVQLQVYFVPCNGTVD